MAAPRKRPRRKVALGRASNEQWEQLWAEFLVLKDRATSTAVAARDVNMMRMANVLMALADADEKALKKLDDTAHGLLRNTAVRYFPVNERARRTARAAFKRLVRAGLEQQLKAPSEPRWMHWQQPEHDLGPSLIIQALRARKRAVLFAPHTIRQSGDRADRIARYVLTGVHLDEELFAFFLPRPVSAADPEKVRRALADQLDEHLIVSKADADVATNVILKALGVRAEDRRAFVA